MLADLYQGDDQLVGETQRNIPSEDDDGYGMDDLVAQYDGYELVESIPHIKEYSTHAMDYPLYFPYLDVMDADANFITWKIFNFHNFENLKILSYISSKQTFL